MSEANELTSFILNDLFLRGIFACRHGVAAGAAEYENREGVVKKRFFKAGITGGHDIFAWIPDYRFLGIEIKIKKDRLRPEQVGFHRNITNMGHLSITVKSKEDYLNQINNLLNAIPKKESSAVFG